METTTIGFIGLGLIGGSIAKAIRKFHPDYQILAYNRTKEVLEDASNVRSTGRSLPLVWLPALSTVIPWPAARKPDMNILQIT